MIQAITKKLTAAFSPTQLEVIDESAKHHGHAGVRGQEGSVTHVKITIAAQAFAGVSKVQRHRMVYAVLAEELGQGGLHAVALKVVE